MEETNLSFVVNQLRKEFGSVTALNDVSLSINGPKILGIAGPNGSGKTTLIQCLLGLVSPTEGEIMVGGTHPMSFNADDRRQIGYMPQHTAIYSDLTVRENVSFFAQLYDVKDRASAVNRSLSFVDLTDRQDSKINELSGGMIRRTSLACALVHDPDILFLDEPTVGLDPELRASMWQGFRQHRDDDTIVVVSTHYLDEVRHCDEVLFLRDGQVLALDTPEAFLNMTDTDDLEDAFLALLEENEPNPSPMDNKLDIDGGNGGMAP
ncbi:MAG: ABC transporter ATP-binding protein [Halobacteriaceae archaeon]